MKNNNEVPELAQEMVDTATMIKRISVRILIVILGLAGIAFAVSSFAYNPILDIEQDLKDINADIVDLQNVITASQNKVEIKQARMKGKRCDLAGLKLEKGMEISDETRAVCFLNGK